MIGATVKGLLGRKLRTGLTGLAIVLGVAMIAGAFVTTDTMLKASDDLKSASYSSADAVVSAKTAFKTSDNGGPASQRKSIPESLTAQVAKAPGVAYAAPELSGQAKLTDRKGKLIDTNGSPPFAVGFDASSPVAQSLSPFKVESGAFPKAANEVAIDKASAKNAGYKLGDTVGVVAEGPVRQYKIAGIVSFGGVDSIGSASAAVFSIAGAQQLFGQPGRIESILVKGKPGTPAADVRSSIAKVLPPGAQVQSAQSQDRFDLNGLDDGLKILRTALLVFGFISLFVGAFIIFNTLGITVAQRTKEFGLLRMIGASRRQILGSVILEAIVIGLIASIVGIAAGFGLAKLINVLFEATGIDLPSAGTVFATRTVIVSLAVGVGITTIAGIGPALRATRIAPVAALREGGMDTRRARSKKGWAFTIVTIVLGIGLVAYGVFGGGKGATEVLSAMGAGSLLLFIGVALIAPYISRPMASFIGRASERLGGPAGRLARDNAMRNPRRTATTAAALMIGIALVTFVAVLGAGIRNGFDDALAKQIKSPYIVTSPDGFAPFAAGAADRLKAEGGVTSTSIREDQVKAFGKKDPIDGVDSNAADLLSFSWREGSDLSLQQLGSDGAIVTVKYADKHHLKVGSRLMVETATGDQLDLTVRGVQKAPEFNPLGLAGIQISRELFDATFEKPQLRYVFVGGSVDQAQLKTALAKFPDAKVWTLAAYTHDQDKQFNQFLSILYALLALSVIVSLFGIVNTLVLSVFERTRELGMLRAVGMTRRQVRRMIRHESIITALIGAALGIGIGLFLSALVTQALSDDGVSFALPLGTLVAFLVVAIVAGVVAAILPARRAARLNVLAALQYE
ncbi:MAG: putative transport system permease protein [Thermoleophilaceae bacterium]|jgi:putative ABC transport system permease protein|nr:putative transport system permease protein [Thermoleophilaceae bacterium]